MTHPAGLVHTKPKKNSSFYLHIISTQPIKSEASGQKVSWNQFVVKMTKTTKVVTLLEYFCYP